jgi:hypothetical protein
MDDIDTLLRGCGMVRTKVFIKPAPNKSKEAKDEMQAAT